MSTPGEGAPPGAADNTNLKAEMDRKLSNIQADMKKSSDALAAQLAGLAAQLQPKQAPKSQTDEAKELEKELYDNPVAFKQRVIKEANDLATNNMNTYLQQQQAATAALGELYSQYPELQQQGHPVALRSVEIFNGMSAAEKASNTAFKLAVSQAASENGLKPLSKREESELDDFALKASGKSRKSGPAIPKNTDLFGQAMGLDMNDPKVRKEIEKYAAYTPQQWINWK